jgi:hypothetical protein
MQESSGLGALKAVAVLRKFLGLILIGGIAAGRGCALLSERP